MLLQLLHDAPLLQLVDLDHRAEQLEVVAAVAGQHLQRADVLGEAGAAISDPGTQEGWADPLIEPHPTCHLGLVGADLLADVGDLVDEGDLGGEEGVGGELDHSCGGWRHRCRRSRRPAAEVAGHRVGGRLVARGSAPTTRFARSGWRKSSTAEPSSKDDRNVGEAGPVAAEDRVAGAGRQASSPSPARARCRRAAPRRRRSGPARVGVAGAG